VINLASANDRAASVPCERCSYVFHGSWIISRLATDQFY